MSQAESLYSLQEIELRILRNQKRLGEIALALKDNKAIVEAQQQVDIARNILIPLQAKMRDCELEIHSNVEKTKSGEQRLYSGTVNNPKELQDIQQEIASLKKWHVELEDRLLEVMVNVEEAQEALDAAQTNLKTITSDWENDHKDLLNEQEQLATAIAELNLEHGEAIKVVEQKNLKIYKSMKPQKANQPIATLIRRTCGVCGIEQTMATEQEVRRGQELVTCPNCGRIFVYRMS